VTEPLVSVVITTYNTGPYLPETLASVFAQSYERYEVIVVDDGSEDDTVERAHQFGDRITLLPRAHEGLGPARNAGIARARGTHLAFLDSDDLWAPETLRTQIEVATRHPDTGLVVADGVHHDAPHIARQRLLDDPIAERVDRSADGTVTDRFYRDFLLGNLVKCPAQTLIPRWAIDAAGPLGATPNGPQDYDYYLRITRRAPATFHRASLARWRFRDDSMSGDADQRNLRWAGQRIAVLDQERADCPPEDRDLLDRTRAVQVREAVRVALLTRMRGVPINPDDLARVSNACRGNPTVLAGRALLALPAPVGRAALRGVWSAREVTRRARSRHR
jgi:glycosyltransferase involved in cell wall biosynthesis